MKNKKANQKPVLRFSPTAWAKLLYLRGKSTNEVGGFGITEADDLLYVTDFITLKQQVSCVSVKFDDQAVADFFEEQVDLGRKPEQFARIWLHTHPADLAEPSITDEETFKRVFGSCQWAVMFILAEDNRTYTRLSFNVGPSAQFQIPVEVDFSCGFGSSDMENWDSEYEANVIAEKWLDGSKDGKKKVMEADNYALPYDFIEKFEQMSPAERQLVLDELAEVPELWDEEREVLCL